MIFTEFDLQINKTADRMYALFAICNALSPSRLDDNIANISKEKYGEQVMKLAKGSVSFLPTSHFHSFFDDRDPTALEELFIHACPKFISANPPPYDDSEALSQLLSKEPGPDPATRHLSLFLSNAAAQSSAPTLRSFLKLYTSLDAKKLSGFLDSDEEEMVQQLMAMKLAGRSVSRVGGETGLLAGSIVRTGDLNFVINEVLYRGFLFRHAL